MTNDFEHPKKAAFLVAYAELGSVTQAARAAEVGRTSHYSWMHTDPEYAKAFQAAHEDACEALEAEARRRAVNGVDEPVFYRGSECGSVRKYSDTLLIFLMKGAMPEKYRERQSIEHSGPGGGPVVVVEDEGWYGNRAHDLAAQGASAPSADPAE